MLNTLESHNAAEESSLSEVLETGGGRGVAEILAIAESRSRYLEASKSKGKEVARKIAKGIGDNKRVGNFELIAFPDVSISPTLSSQRAHDTFTYGK